MSRPVVEGHFVIDMMFISWITMFSKINRKALCF